MGPLGFYQHKMMPFGLTNAPTTFQRLIENCLGDLNLHWYIIYLDDIAFFSKGLACHLERLEAVFQKLEEAGLKLKHSKCELFWWQIAFLGHMIYAQGVTTHEVKPEAIKNWPTPTNVTDVQSFLGFMGYYFQFIPKFAQVAQPLHQLTWVRMLVRKGCHPEEQQMPLGLWRPEKTVYHHTYSCLCKLYPTFHAPHWCLWVWFCSLSDPWGWHGCCNSLYQWELEQGWMPLSST